MGGRLLRGFGITVNAARRRLADWVSGCVPDATAEGVALFRVALGGVLLYVLTVHNPAKPDALDGFGRWVTPWLVTCSTLFVAGAATSFAYAGLLLGVAAWAVATQAGSHPYAAFVVALVSLTPSRWGDAWGVDAWRRGAKQPTPATPKQYGYTVWVPALVMGLLLEAAAFAKLMESGTAWITNGTVKYHFMTDAAHAPVDWGTRIGTIDSVAVLLSLGAMVTEVLVLPAVLSGRYWLRAAAGAGAAGLLGGFYLFQGLFWPGWWSLLLGFLPWHLVGGTARHESVLRPRGLSAVQLTLLVVLVVQQVLSSAFRLEVRPVLSTYDMYSTTYSSPAEYEEKSSRLYRIVARSGDGQSIACDIASDVARETAAALRDNQPIGPVLERCFPQRSSIESVTVEVRRADVDWLRWQIRGERLVVLAGPSRVSASP